MVEKLFRKKISTCSKAMIIVLLFCFSMQICSAKVVKHLGAKHHVIITDCTSRMLNPYTNFAKKPVNEYFYMDLNSHKAVTRIGKLFETTFDITHVDKAFFSWEANFETESVSFTLYRKKVNFNGFILIKLII